LEPIEKWSHDDQSIIVWTCDKDTHYEISIKMYPPELKESNVDEIRIRHSLDHLGMIFPNGGYSFILFYDPIKEWHDNEINYNYVLTPLQMVAELDKQLKYRNF
jgi:hypothetical protein